MRGGVDGHLKFFYRGLYSRRGMEFSAPSTSGVGSAPDEDAVNLVSDAFAELSAFMANNGSVSADSTDYHFLDRKSGRKYRYGPEDMIQYFESIEACRRDGCVLHILEHVDDSPAGLMIDLDRKQDSPGPSIFTGDFIHNIVMTLARIITDLTCDVAAERRSFFSDLDEMTRKLHDDIESAALSESAAFDPRVAPAAAAASAAAEAPQARAKGFHVFVIKRTRITLDTLRKNYKDGIHLLIPELRFTKSERKGICAAFRGALDAAYPGSGSMVDQNSASVSTHLVGSCKIGGIPYELAFAARIVRTGGDNSIIPLSVAALSAGLTAPVEEGGIKINLAYELALTQYLPRIRGQPTWLRKERAEISPEKSAQFDEHFAHIDTSRTRDAIVRGFEEELAQLVGADADAAFLSDLVNALPVAYATDYARWISVLMIIASPTGNATCPQNRPIAQQFSMRAPDKWDPAAFSRKWEEFVGRARGGAAGGAARLTQRSLEFWVRTENPQAFEDARRRNARGFLMTRIYETGGELHHVTVAEILHRMLRGTYARDTDAPDRSMGDYWYEFVTERSDHIKQGEIYKWRPVRIPHAIYSHASCGVLRICQDIERELRERIERARDETQRVRYAQIRKTLAKQMGKLRDDAFLNGARKQLEHMLDIRGFIESMDQQQNIIGVGNGILEFIPERSHEPGVDRAEVLAGYVPRLIRGFHELRVMRYTDVDYVPYDEASPYVRDIMEVYRTIFIEPDVLEFVLFYLSTWLDSYDSARLLLMLGGGGSNGKTWSVLFAHRALGEKYVRTLKMQLLTEDREKARDANSALMQLKGLRGGFFDEANEGDKINPARVKSLVTPGEQSGRELYSREEQFRNTANLAAISNYDFIVNATDSGTWDRLLYYTCKSRFSLAPDPASPFEHLIRPELTGEWPNNPYYRSAMLSILVHYRLRLEREYRGNVRDVPRPTIDAETRAFRTKQDPITRFVTERVVISTPETSAALSVVIDSYARWYRAVFNAHVATHALDTTFQNSLLGRYITRGEDGTLRLVGARVRDDQRDALREGERLME